MEIGIDNTVPTYSGGLGVLAGDTIKSAADLDVPMVAVTLIHENGYFTQKLTDKGEQIELPVRWNREDYLKHLRPKIKVEIEGREVVVSAWEYIVTGVNGHTVPIIFLDTNNDGNIPEDRDLTGFLYGGDQRYRLCQEAILGIGGIRMLKALGFHRIEKFHMNEGHSALLAVELLRIHKETATEKKTGKGAIEAIKSKCVFTTHTPVPAGHDRFDQDLVRRVIPDFPFRVSGLIDSEGKVNLTLIALKFSSHVNGVSKKHGEVSQQMFPAYRIGSITNGVHTGTWVSKPFSEVFDRYLPGWKADPYLLRNALSIPDEEIWDAHTKCKKELLDFVNSNCNYVQGGMDCDVFTIGYARRATPYKRPDLLFHDLVRLMNIAQRAGKIQIIYAGKAHPMDNGGKEAIARIFSLMPKLEKKIRMAYLENYDMVMAKKLVAGVDVWLNTPIRPREASGTSGMKAVHNGVPNLSVLDGWWIEGCVEGVTGWAVGPMPAAKQGDTRTDNPVDAADLYRKLDEKVIPMFYHHKDDWVEMMKNVIAIDASYFNTHRMVNEYIMKAYYK